jgi:hypothetical protein
MVRGPTYVDTMHAKPAGELRAECPSYYVSVPYAMTVFEQDRYKIAERARLRQWIVDRYVQKRAAQIRLNGTPLGIVNYDPWGTPESGTVPTFGFTGELRDAGAHGIRRIPWAVRGQRRPVAAAHDRSG